MQQPAELGTVLLVDDYLPLLRNTAFLLEITGFHTLTATNGAEALALMEDQTPDVIISDIEMPQLSGLDLLQAVRADARWQALPFIVASAHYELDDVLHCLDLGADDYIPKPFDIYDVLDSIQRTAPFVTKQLHPIAS